MSLLSFASLFFAVALVALLTSGVKPHLRLGLCSLVGLAGCGIVAGLRIDAVWHGTLAILLSAGALMPLVLSTFFNRPLSFRVWIATAASVVGLLIVFSVDEGSHEAASTMHLFTSLFLAFLFIVSLSLLVDSARAFSALTAFRARTLLRATGLAFCLAAVLMSCIPAIAFADVLSISASLSVAGGITYTVVREPYLLLSYSVRKLLEANPNMAAEDVRNLLAGVGCLLDGTAPVDLWIGAPDAKGSFRLTSEALIPALAESEVPSGWTLGEAFSRRQMQSDSIHLFSALGGAESSVTGSRTLTEGLELSSIRPLVQFTQDKARRYFGDEILTASATMQALLFKAIEESARSRWFIIAGDSGVGRTAVARVIAAQRRQPELLVCDCSNSSERHSIANTVSELKGSPSGLNSIGVLCSGLETLNEQELAQVVTQLADLPPAVAVYCRVQPQFVDVLLEQLSGMSSPPALSVLDIPALRARPIDTLLQFCQFVDQEAKVQQKPIHRLENVALLEALQAASVGNSGALRRAAALAVSQSVAGVVWTAAPRSEHEGV